MLRECCECELALVCNIEHGSVRAGFSVPFRRCHSCGHCEAVLYVRDEAGRAVATEMTVSADWACPAGLERVEKTISGHKVVALCAKCALNLGALRPDGAGKYVRKYADDHFRGIGNVRFPWPRVGPGFSSFRLDPDRVWLVLSLEEYRIWAGRLRPV